MQPISLYLISMRFLSASRTVIRNGLPECSSRSPSASSVLILLFPSMITLRTEYRVPSWTTNVRSISPGFVPGRVTGVTFASKKPCPW